MRQFRLPRRRFLGAGATAAVGAGSLALVGCGGDDDAAQTGTATTTTGASASRSASAAASGSASASASGTAAAGTPKDGSYYAMHSVMTGITLDLHRELYRATPYQTGMAYNNLLIWDDVDKGTIKPDIAKSLPQQPDKQTFVFTIRNDVKWQNKAPANGRALTMDDIKWNIERQIAQKLVNGETATNFYRYSQIFNRIDKTEYIDATTFKITLKAPDATWLANMCDEFNGIGYKDVFEAIENDFGTFDPKYILGTGPYIFDSYNPAKGAHAVRNPDYFRKKSGEQVQFFDEMNWINLGTDINPIRTAFEGKQIDIINTPTGDVADAIAGAHTEVKRLQVPNPEGSFIMAYDWLKNPAFSNPKLRQAIYVAIDRKLVGDQNFGGLARPNPGIPWAFGDWALPQTELQTMAGYRPNKDDDIKEARALWSAGGGDAIDASALELIALSPAYSEWLPAMLNKNLGINKFSVKVIPPATGLQYLQAAPAIGYVGGWGQWVSPDPRIRFGQVRLKGQINNFWKYENADLERIMAQAFAEFDRAKATDLLKQAQRLIHNDAGGSHMEISGPIAQWLYWPYLHRIGPSFVRYEKQLAERSWIDQADPSFQGRKKA